MAETKTIMIVDDDDDIRLIVSAFLEREGYDCIKASSGMEALETLKKETVDLILLDIMMPGIDGFEVLDRLRKDERTESIPVIMLTGVEDREKTIDALNKGVTYFINKPFETIDLASKIRVALSGEVL